MSSVNERNFAALEQAMNTLYKEFSELNKRMVSLETQNAQLRTDVAQQKQITAAALGVRVGPTVR